MGIIYLQYHLDMLMNESRLKQASLPTKAKSFASWLSSMCVATSVAVTAITGLQPISTVTLKDTDK